MNNLSGQKYKNGGVRCNINGGISIFHSNKVINEFGGEYSPLLNFNSQLSFDIPLRDRTSFFEFGLNFKYFNFRADDYPNSNVGVSYVKYIHQFYFFNVGYGKRINAHKKISISPKVCLYIGSYEFYKSDVITKLFNGTSYTTGITDGSTFNFTPGFSIGSSFEFELNHYCRLIIVPYYDYWMNFNEIPKHTGFFNFSLGLNFLIRSQEELEGK